MEVDESAWPEINERLGAIDRPHAEVQLLVTHLRDRLVSHFGAELFDVWRAKEGLHRHTAEEVASVVVTELAPLIEQLPPGAISTAAADGTIAAPIRFPWDEPFPYG